MSSPWETNKWNIQKIISMGWKGKWIKIENYNSKREDYKEELITNSICWTNIGKVHKGDVHKTVRRLHESENLIPWPAIITTGKLFFVNIKTSGTGKELR